MAEEKKAPKKEAPKKNVKPKTDKIAKPKPEKKAAKTDFKYGVPYLAEKQGITEFSVRMRLRDNGYKPNAGNQYGWENKAEADAVHAKIWGDKKKAA